MTISQFIDGLLERMPGNVEVEIKVIGRQTISGLFSKPNGYRLRKVWDAEVIKASIGDIAEVEAHLILNELMGNWGWPKSA